MHRSLVKVAGTTLGAVVLAGCTSPNTYQPEGNDMQHAVYAGKAAYPYDSHSEMAPHLFCTVAAGAPGTPSPIITIYNAGDESYDEFELWVNKLYTLHVKKLEAKSQLSFNPKDLYNAAASSLVDAPANSITTVEIYISSTGKLLTAQGPILPR